MRKTFCAILLLIVLAANSFAAAAASPAPAEIPEVKFLINGNPIVLSDVPLGLNGRTMLPLRAVLVALGVPDDEEHIKWDGNEKSVSINYNGSSIYLKLDSKTAYIDGSAVEMDVAPFGYDKNQRIYLPVRFTARAVGKEAAWDDYSRTVYLRDREAYSGTAAILEKTEAIMKAAARAKIDTEMAVTIVNQGEGTGFDVKIKEEQDRTAGILHSEITLPILENLVTFENYYKDNIEYGKGMGNEKWKKTPMKEKDFKELFDNEMSLLSINSMEMLSATMSQLEGGNPDEILLAGKVYPKGIVKNLAVYSGMEKLEAKEYSAEVTVDRNTGLLKSIFIEISGRFKNKDGYSEVHAEIKAVYSEINGDFVLSLPDMGN